MTVFYTPPPASTYYYNESRRIIEEQERRSRRKNKDRYDGGSLDDDFNHASNPAAEMLRIKEEIEKKITARIDEQRHASKPGGSAEIVAEIGKQIDSQKLNNAEKKSMKQEMLDEWLDKSVEIGTCSPDYMGQHLIDLYGGLVAPLLKAGANPNAREGAAMSYCGRAQATPALVDLLYKHGGSFDKGIDCVEWAGYAREEAVKLTGKLKELSAQYAGAHHADVKTKKNHTIAPGGSKS